MADRGSSLRIGRSRWAALDALVDEEVEALSRRAVPVAPDVAERLFLEQVEAYLTGHPDPRRLLDQLQARFAPVPPAPAAKSEDAEIDPPEVGKTP